MSWNDWDAGSQGLIVEGYKPKDQEQTRSGVKSRLEQVGSKDVGRQESRTRNQWTGARSPELDLSYLVADWSLRELMLIRREPYFYR